MARLLTRGHPAAAAAIGTMIVGPTPHAIVIAGPAGVGKMTLALDLAAGLLCGAPEPSDRPCRECRGCKLVERGVHSDVHRLVPSGPGNQIRIGDRSEPEPGTVRRLISELSLLPVEGGARVAIVEKADRLNEDAQSALLKTLEEPPPGVTIVLCVDREDQLLPTVRSRCVRLRLGPVPVREIEEILAEQGVADPPTAARLARLSTGRPGIARNWALAPEAVTARAEIARSLLDLTVARPAERLSVGRDLLVRAGDVVRALERSERPVAPAPTVGRTRRGSKTASPVTAAPAPVIAASIAADSDRPEAADDDTETARDVRAPAAERRRAAATLVEIWRDVARDLLLVGLGDERQLRDPGLLDDLRASTAATAVPRGDLSDFLGRLDLTLELLESNVSPELAVDVLLLAWPGRARAA